MCGGTASWRAVPSGTAGLSPRVRGNRDERVVGCVCAGSIPACAGEPVTADVVSGASTVYPRVCGGTACFRSDGTEIGGLSPRVRGNPHAIDPSIMSRRSIPACAGEPDIRNSWHRRRWVYPRVCGGTNLYECGECGELGLSPRVRGNPHARIARWMGWRSIPACAGEPTP